VAGLAAAGAAAGAGRAAPSAAAANPPPAKGVPPGCCCCKDPGYKVHTQEQRCERGQQGDRYEEGGGSSRHMCCQHDMVATYDCAIAYLIHAHISGVCIRSVVCACWCVWVLSGSCSDGCSCLSRRAHPAICCQSATR
jgi:hypothetical protein